jgi:hypothetical protein
MADELSLLLKQAELPPKESNDFSKIKQEFALFQKTGKRTEHLELIHEPLCTRKPTSTDPERTFSVAANFCTKIRSRLSDQSLNSLIFLKYYYLRLKKKDGKK